LHPFDIILPEVPKSKNRGKQNSLPGGKNFSMEEDEDPCGQMMGV